MSGEALKEIDQATLLLKVREEVARRRAGSGQAETRQPPAHQENFSLGLLIAQAEHYADVGARVSPMEKFHGLTRRLARLAGRAVVFLASFITDRQRQYNTTIIQTVRILDGRLLTLEREIDRLKTVARDLETELTALRQTRASEPAPTECSHTMQQFRPYIAQDRVMNNITFDFYIADEVGRQWYDCSPNQWMPERQWCLDHILPGFTILDCGAHHGMMSVIFSKLTGPSGRVIAWEAVPSNARVIEKNALLNGLTNLSVRSIGLGARRQQVRVNLNAGNCTVRTAGNTVEADDSATIDIVSLDEDLDPTVKVDFIKIDVEGSDLEMLMGASRVLSHRPIIDLELHTFLFKDRRGTLSLIFEIIDKGNYTYEVLPEVVSELVRIHGTVDLDWLAQFDNPHVFCVPNP